MTSLLPAPIAHFLCSKTLKQSCLNSVSNFSPSISFQSGFYTHHCPQLPLSELPMSALLNTVVGFHLNSEAVDTLISFFLWMNFLLLASRIPCSWFSFCFTDFFFSAALWLPPHLPDLLVCPGRSPSRDAFSVYIHCISDLRQSCGLCKPTNEKSLPHLHHHIRHLLLVPKWYFFFFF